MIRDAGFGFVKHENLTGGIAAIHSGFKLWNENMKICIHLFELNNDFCREVLVHCEQHITCYKEENEDFQIWLIWPNQVTGGTDHNTALQALTPHMSSGDSRCYWHRDTDSDNMEGDAEENPRLILLFSGKRKSGKDFITDLLQVSLFKKEVEFRMIYF